MKKYTHLFLFLCLALIIVFSAGCGADETPSDRASAKPSGVNEVLEAGMAQADSEKSDDSSRTDGDESEAGPQIETAESDENTAAEENPSDTAETGENTAAGKNPSETAEAVENATAGEGQSEAAEPANEEASAPSPSPGADVDLTILSSTMVYSEVYSMMFTPEKYIGRTVKMEGIFAYYYVEETDRYYYSCFIQDATACCSQGIEFILTDDYTYPDDYPEPGEEICVTGVFDTYEEDGFTYCTLRDAKLL